MKNQTDPTPAGYRQPIREYIGRTLEGTLEKVDYVPHTHLRIWYNVQPEGYAEHHHDAMEFIVVRENPYPVSVGETQTVLNPGDIFYIPPKMPHHLSGGSGSRFIMLIDPAPLSCFTDYKALDPFLMRPQLVNARTQPELYAPVRDLLDEIVSIYFAANDMWELSIYSRMLKILALCGKAYFAARRTFYPEQGERSQVNYEKFANLMEYIDQHYAEPLTLEWAADYVGFSKYHFHRLFKEYTGTTFHDHLLRKRVQVAQSLLLGPGTITEIAFQTGFSGSTAFGRVFRQITGLTPSEYRHKRETYDTYGMSTYIYPSENATGD